MHRQSTCAGVFNAVAGKKKIHVIVYSKYIAPPESAAFVVGVYGGVPAIVSKQCDGVGSSPGPDGGRVCKHCRLLRQERGSRNPVTNLNLWYPPLVWCEERRGKPVLCSTDFIDANKFVRNHVQFFTPNGLILLEEARAQVEYGAYMVKLTKQLPP